MGLDHVDIFYSHRFDPETPLEETMGALATAVQSGRARTPASRRTRAERTREAAALLRELGVPLLIHQPSYSMLNRWVEDGDPSCWTSWARRASAASRSRRWPRGCSPTATSTASRRTRGPPRASRWTRRCSPTRRWRTSGALNEIAQARGQSLAQLALAWVLRDERVTSVLIGASSVEQLDDNLAALDNLEISRGGARRDRAGRRRQPGSTSGRRPARSETGRPAVKPA